MESNAYMESFKEYAHELYFAGVSVIGATGDLPPTAKKIVADEYCRLDGMYARLLRVRH